MKISGAVFDMDGTLVDSLGFWDYIWEVFGKKYLNDPAFRPDSVTEKAVRTVSLYAGMALVHENCRIGKSKDEVFALANEILIDFYKNRVEMKPGAREFLDYLKKSGVKMCIASATASELVSIVMERFKLTEYFPVVFSCNDIGKGKEHPDVFTKAHEFLGTEKESTWIFEDSVAALETAVKAGYKTVGIYDKFNFGLDRVKEISTVYVGENDSLKSLINTVF